MSLKLLATAVLAVSALCAPSAHAEPLTVQPMRYQVTGQRDAPGPRDKVVMPYVQGAAPDVVSRINDMLFIEMLTTLAPPQPVPVWRVASNPEAAGMASLAYRVLRNDGRVLTLALDAEGCGAYCENYTRSFSFEASTGRRLLPQELLTPAGLAAVARTLTRERQARLRAEVARLKQLPAPRRGAGRQDDADTRAAQVELYQSCSRGVTVDSLHFDDFQVGAEALHFTGERCSNHAMRALDTLDTFGNDLAFDTLPDGQLTPLGRALLRSGPSSPASGASPVFNQVLKGRIGAKSAVTMRLVLEGRDGAVSGVYFYDKFRAPIALQGQLQGRQLLLEENHGGDSPAPGPNATFTLSTTAAGRLRGHWQAEGQSGPLEVDVGF